VAAVFALLFALLAHPAQARPPQSRALLIGVGDYANLPPRLRLQAPGRDVESLRATLIGAGLNAASVATLAQASATRAAILQALADLKRTAEPGDRVLVYFSGHGAQAPARYPEREPDGLEELYLAADAARWDGGRHAVPGAIADYELEAALDAIRAKGADVWFVADACHGAGLTRGAPGQTVKRVSAADLGLPRATRAVRGAVERTPARGRFTGFYAAQPGEAALERQGVSVFTQTLTRAIREGRLRSLRDLALGVSMGGGEGAPAPVFDGPLDGPVLDLAPGPRSVAVASVGGRLSVQAGRLEGFEPGAVVDLFRADGSRAGRARVREADLAQAVLISDDPSLAPPLFARATVPAPSETRGGRLLSELTRLPLASSLKVEAGLWRGGCGPNPPARLGLPVEATPFDPLQAPALRHCDVIYLRLTNTGPTPLDVSPLYLDAAGTIAALSLSPGDDVRIPPGESRFAALRLLTRGRDGRPLPHGTERLALVVAPADGARRLDLRGLADASLERGAGLSSGAQALVFAWRLQDN
jgi:hypothetical protein